MARFGSSRRRAVESVTRREFLAAGVGAVLVLAALFVAIVSAALGAPGGYAGGRLADRWRTHDPGRTRGLGRVEPRTSANASERNRATRKAARGE